MRMKARWDQWLYFFNYHCQEQKSIVLFSSIYILEPQIPQSVTCSLMKEVKTHSNRMNIEERSSKPNMAIALLNSILTQTRGQNGPVCDNKYTQF